MELLEHHPDEPIDHVADVRVVAAARVDDDILTFCYAAEPFTDHLRSPDEILRAHPTENLGPIAREDMRREAVRLLSLDIQREKRRHRKHLK